MARDITPDEQNLAAGMLARARAAMAEIADYDQARVDRLAQAIGWALGNETTFTRLAHMSVDESGIGDREGRVGKRFKIHGILRDALRARSVGVIEENPAKGLVKYAKPAGVIASIVPMTNPELTPPGTAIYAIKARDAVIFSPHPRTKRTTNEVVRILREVMEREGAPADVFQCVEEPSIPLSQELMAICDLTLATGGAGMVRGRLQLGQARLRCRRRQLDDGDRRDRRCRRSRPELAGCRRPPTTARDARPTATCSSTIASTTP